MLVRVGTVINPPTFFHIDYISPCETQNYMQFLTNWLCCVNIGHVRLVAIDQSILIGEDWYIYIYIINWYRSLLLLKMAFHLFDVKLFPELMLAFYTPVWKTDVSCRGNVRPSVRLRFPDFSSTCFEISIWSLVYIFSQWHDMSSLKCITIGSLWPSLQPKVGQTNFLQSWSQKSR